MLRRSLYLEISQRGVKGGRRSLTTKVLNAKRRRPAALLLHQAALTAWLRASTPALNLLSDAAKQRQVRCERLGGPTCGQRAELRLARIKKLTRDRHLAGLQMSMAAAVCTFCDAETCASLHYLGRGRYNRTGGATWHSPVLPPSVDFLDAIACEPAGELGRSHAKLPVTHTSVFGEKAPWRRRNGLWFFYARGCSDFAWDVGRTLLVQNRYDLALTLEQRLRGGSRRAAVQRLAADLQRPRHAPPATGIRRRDWHESSVAVWASALVDRAMHANQSFMRYFRRPGANLSLATMLLDASRGIIADPEADIGTSELRPTHMK